MAEAAPPTFDENPSEPDESSAPYDSDDLTSVWEAPRLNWFWLFTVCCLYVGIAILPHILFNSWFLWPWTLLIALLVLAILGIPWLHMFYGEEFLFIENMFGWGEAYERDLNRLWGRYLDAMAYWASRLAKNAFVTWGAAAIYVAVFFLLNLVVNQSDFGLLAKLPFLQDNENLKTAAPWVASAALAFILIVPLISAKFRNMREQRYHHDLVENHLLPFLDDALRSWAEELNDMVNDEEEDPGISVGSSNVSLRFPTPRSQILVAEHSPEVFAWDESIEDPQGTHPDDENEVFKGWIRVHITIVRRRGINRVLESIASSDGGWQADRDVAFLLDEGAPGWAYSRPGQNRVWTKEGSLGKLRKSTRDKLSGTAEVILCRAIGADLRKVRRPWFNRVFGVLIVTSDSPRDVEVFKDPLFGEVVNEKVESIGTRLADIRKAYDDY